MITKVINHSRRMRSLSKRSSPSEAQEVLEKGYIVIWLHPQKYPHMACIHLQIEQIFLDCWQNIKASTSIEEKPNDRLEHRYLDLFNPFGLGVLLSYSLPYVMTFCFGMYATELYPEVVCDEAALKKYLISIAEILFRALKEVRIV